jgi:hypothetical protein
VTANATAKATADPYGMTTREQATANANAGFFASLRMTADTLRGNLRRCGICLMLEASLLLEIV